MSETETTTPTSTTAPDEAPPSAAPAATTAPAPAETTTSEAPPAVLAEAAGAPPGVSTEELHQAVEAHLDAGGTVVLEQPRDGSPAIEHRVLDAAVVEELAGDPEEPPGAGGIDLVFRARCGKCGTRVELERPAGIDHRHWLDNSVTDDLARAMHAEGCNHF